MNFLQRAWCSVLRRKGKSLILFLVIFILGNVIAGAIAIQQSTSNVEKKVKADLGARVSVQYDWQAYEEENGQDYSVETEELTEEQIQELGKMSYVKEYDYSTSSYISVDKFKTISFENEEDGGVMYVGMDNYINITGTQMTEPLDFKDKKVSLVEGRTFEEAELDSDNYVALISSSLAQENGLAVGDEFILDGQYMTYKDDGSSEKEKGRDYAIEIIGIFDPVTLEKETSDDKDQQNGMSNDPYFENMRLNTLYMTNTAIKDINAQEMALMQEKDPETYKQVYGDEEQEPFYATPTYILKSPEDVEAFKEEAQHLLPKYQKFVASTDSYDQVGGSMQKLSKISGYVVIIAIIATLVIISLVVVLFLRDRKHELGIYLSLGEKRQNVLLQIIVELLVISLIAMCLSLVTGNFLGKTVSESMLQSDMLTESSNNSMYDMMYMDPYSTINTDLTADDVQNAYQVEFSASYIVTFLVAGLLTVLGSAILPLLYILRLNPKKIMM